MRVAGFELTSPLVERRPHSWLLFAIAVPFVSCASPSPSATSENSETSADAETDAEAEGADNTETGESEETGATSCTGLVCDKSCCGSDEECVNGVCVAACASEIRCGEEEQECCEAGEFCLNGNCSAGTGTCKDSWDCPPHQYCEPFSESCVNQDETPACEEALPSGSFSPIIEWQFDDEEIVSTPLVADMDGDGVQEVVVNMTRVDVGPGVGAIGWWDGEVAILNGETGNVELVMDHEITGYGSHGRASLAIGDVDGDGLPDIVYPGRTTQALNTKSFVHAINYWGTVLWTAHDDDAGLVEHRFTVSNGGATLANFDDDPEAEIVIGASLIDNDGRVMWDEGGDGGVYGSDPTYAGGLSAIADLDDDGAPEIISGRHAWKVDSSLNVTPYWDAGGVDGHPAVSDLDQDGSPEVVLVGGSTIRVLDGRTGLPWCATDDCTMAPAVLAHPVVGGGRGGPPTIADFDGDGRPEIGVAGGNRYAVYDIYREDEELYFASDFPAPVPGQLFVRWYTPTQDESSNTTGASVFDFEGDGSAEVIYGDECFMRAFDGATGEVKIEIPSSSGTVHEYPILVDVDSDDEAEILIVANSTEADVNCAGVPNYSGIRHGLYVYGDAAGRWVGTRDLWTQHTYHVTNADNAGNVPMGEVASWDPSLGFNSYRHNPATTGSNNAPDIALDLALSQQACPDSVDVLVRVSNLGIVGLPTGVGVSVYLASDPNGAPIASATTTEALPPGGYTYVTVSLPGDSGEVLARADADDAVIECNETNNEASVLVTCEGSD